MLDHSVTVVAAVPNATTASDVLSPRSAMPGSFSCTTPLAPLPRWIRSDGSWPHCGTECGGHPGSACRDTIKAVDAKRRRARHTRTRRAAGGTEPQVEAALLQRAYQQSGGLCVTDERIDGGESGRSSAHGGRDALAFKVTTALDLRLAQRC